MSNTSNSFSPLIEAAPAKVDEAKVQDHQADAQHDTQADHQVDDQYDDAGEQADPQLDAEADAVDYTIGPDELAVIALATGYLAKWNAEDESGNSMAKDYNNTRVCDAGPRLASWALLAAIDDLRIRSATDPTLVPVLCAVARTQFPAMARSGLRMDPHPLSEQVHRAFVDRDSFNPRVNLTSAEREGLLGQSSVWTLAKWVSAQWRAGVNRCFAPNLRDLPIVPTPAQPKGGKGKKQAADFDSEGRRERSKPVSRCPEESAWNRYASPDLVGALYDIKDAYNRMLCSSPDLSQAYKEQGRLRRERREAAFAKRQLEYEAQRQERSKNPPKDFKPQNKGKPAPGARTESKAQPRDAKPRDSKPRDSKPRDSKPRTEAKAPADGESNFNAPAQRPERVRVQRAPKPKPQVDADGFVTVGRKSHSKEKSKRQTDA